MPAPVRPSSLWIWGAAIDTIVWSMKLIDTAKIIAARTRFPERLLVSGADKEEGQAMAELE
jgi:hypothetical protein